MPRRDPASYRIERDTLIILDGEGRELWTKSFPNLRPEANPEARVAWFEDIDGDGHPEVLFTYSPKTDTLTTATLFCYSHTGRLLWQFTPGHPVRTATETFDPIFYVRNLAVVDYGNQKAIVTIALHVRYYPAQIAVLSPKGELISEYWHAGHLHDIAIHDINRDGKPQVYLTGIDNAARMATMVVLDVDRIRGAGKEDKPAYQFLDMPIATERERLYFHRSPINKISDPYNSAQHVLFTDHEILVNVDEQLVVRESSMHAVLTYVLDSDFNLHSISVPDGYLAVHKQFEDRHLLAHKFSDAELQPLHQIRQP